MRGRYWKRKTGGWAIALYVDGMEHRESVARAIGKQPAEVTERDAEALLELRRHEAREGRFVPLRAARRPFREAWATYLDDLRLRGRVGPVKGHATLILERWGDTPTSNITTVGIRRWLLDLQARGYTLGTCSTELGYLRAALRLAHQDGHVGRLPRFPTIKPQNARQGFFEPEQFAAVLPHLREPINDLAEFYYATGWRHDEVLGLRWAWVERGRRIVLPDSKTGEGRVVPLADEAGRPTPLAAIIERRWSKREYRRPNGTTALAEHVFHRAGRPVLCFRKQWASACAKAGIQRYVHDFRRTVARDGMEAGNDPFAVMALTGHKSLSTFKRYNIIDTRRVATAMQRMASYRAGRPAVVTDIARTAPVAIEKRA